MNKYCPPFYYMPMPVTADGNGPADQDETVATLHEVWDGICNIVCRCENEAIAVHIAATLNSSKTPAP